MTMKYIWSLLQVIVVINGFPHNLKGSCLNDLFDNLETVSKTLSVLKVSAAAKSVKIKLTRKISPCLTFEIDLVSLV